MPRPTKFDQKTADRILTALKAGNTRTASALYAGIDYSTLKRWSERNAEFCAALDRAEAEAEVGHVTRIAKAAQDGDWKASAWWLERRRHEDWRRRESQDVNLSGTVSLSSLSDEELEARIADLQGRSGSTARAARGTEASPVQD